MRLEFIWIGKTKESALRQLEDRYLQRIGHFFAVARRTVAEAKRSDRHSQKGAERAEAKAVAARLKPGFRLVVLDERGKQFSSRELARWLRGLLEASISVTFLVGGHSGVPGEIRRRADLKLSLSRMTLTHEMTRTILLEQVYRAATILKGTPYHK